MLGNRLLFINFPLIIMNLSSLLSIFAGNKILSTNGNKGTNNKEHPPRARH